MKWPSLNTILIVVAVVFVTLSLRSCFDKKTPDEKIIRADIKIEQLENQRKADSAALKTARDKYDSLIAISTERITDLENKKQPIINVIKKIPATINNLDKEQLRRAIAGW